MYSDSVDVAEVVHRDDVRFLQPRRHPRLAPETLLVARVRGHLRAQQLDRHHALLDGVVGAVHLTHAADTDQRLQLIRPESGAQPRAAMRGGHQQSFLQSRSSDQSFGAKVGARRLPFPIRMFTQMSGYAVGLPRRRSAHHCGLVTRISPVVEPRTARKVIAGEVLAEFARNHATPPPDPLGIASSARNRFVGLVTKRDGRWGDGRGADAMRPVHRRIADEQGIGRRAGPGTRQVWPSQSSRQQQ